jgi:hypothetical protein
MLPLGKQQDILDFLFDDKSGRPVITDQTNLETFTRVATSTLRRGVFLVFYEGRICNWLLLWTHCD